ncbi:iron-containing redox enzyme family protein, partial [cf. Phormidesmis sp. LEGE 11477]|uniref:iron-containing redox enzyme family protein n=1 Tax=cf. Phormidesmis sp. LEGE 11477 TaxID=1828680 RepID=UPI0019EE8C96
MLDILQRNNSKPTISIRKDITKLSPEIVDTQRLLDGAILAAWEDAICTKQYALPKLTATRWVWRLAGSYHTTHSTPALLRRAAERFVSIGQWDLARWASEKAVEEQNHDQLALLDIEAMGHDPITVVENLVPPAARELVDYFSIQVEAANPLGVLGYSYTLERLAMRVTDSTVENVESILPKTVNATRCLRTHSSIGADADHIKENLEVIARLSLSEQYSIAISCYETAKMCFTPPEEGHISEFELQYRLQSKCQIIDTFQSFSSSTKALFKKLSTIQQPIFDRKPYPKNVTEQLDYLFYVQLQDGLPNGIDEAW